MSDSFPTGFTGPLSLDYGTTGRAASLTIKVVNVGLATTYYAASGTGITEPEVGFYTKAAFAYPSVTGTYRSAWYDGGVYISGSADEFRVAAVAPTALVTSVPGNSVSSLNFIIKRNDTDPAISVQALYPDPNDPTGATLIPWPIPIGATAKFTMRDVNDFTGRTRTAFPASAPKIHATANIDDNTNGLMSYGWDGAGDTDTDGVYRAEFEITTLGGEIRTFPTGVTDSSNWITVTITDDLDPGINP